MLLKTSLNDKNQKGYWTNWLQIMNDATILNGTWFVSSSFSSLNCYKLPPLSPCLIGCSETAHSCHFSSIGEFKWVAWEIKYGPEMPHHPERTLGPWMPGWEALFCQHAFQPFFSSVDFISAIAFVAICHWHLPVTIWSLEAIVRCNLSMAYCDRRWGFRLGNSY